jgi:hypothetical protein
MFVVSKMPIINRLSPGVKQHLIIVAVHYPHLLMMAIPSVTRNDVLVDDDGSFPV